MTNNEINTLLLTKVKVVKLEADEFKVIAEDSISAVCKWIGAQTNEHLENETVLALVHAVQEHPGKQIGVVLKEDGLIVSVF